MFLRVLTEICTVLQLNEYKHILHLTLMFKMQKGDHRYEQFNHMYLQNPTFYMQNQFCDFAVFPFNKK